MGKPDKKGMIRNARDTALKTMKDAVSGKPIADGARNVISQKIFEVLAEDVPKALKKGLTVEQKIEKLKNDKLFMKFANSAGWTEDDIIGAVKGAAADYYRRRELVDAETERRGQQKIGRNELCPCGSGKKYKKCCGR